jgi:hypothetical protein
LGGVGWLLSLSPPLATSVLALLMVVGILAEAPLMLWLLVMGVKQR